MKKRVLTLMLALAMTVAFAAPAFAMQLGDSFTKTELAGLGLTAMYVQEGGFTGTGDRLNLDGEIEEDTEVSFGPGERLYIDEDGMLYKFMPVMSVDGYLKYQLIFIGEYDPDMNLDEKPLDLTIFRGSVQRTRRTHGVKKDKERWFGGDIYVW